MDWTLFAISAGVWIFFAEHFIWLGRFKTMEEHGIPVPISFAILSRAICNIAVINMLVFLAVYGFKVSWLSSVVIVVGGYIVSLLYVFATRGFHSTTLHRVGWVALPTLSIGIWVYAFAA